MVPADDQAMVLPCASVMVIMVLLNEALTCATPEVIFLRSRRRGFPRWTWACSLAISIQLPNRVNACVACRQRRLAPLPRIARCALGRLLLAGDRPRGT